MEDDQDKNEPSGYTWEKFERSWDILEEDETGALKSTEKDDQRAKKKRRMYVLSREAWSDSCMSFLI